MLLRGPAQSKAPQEMGISVQAPPIEVASPRRFPALTTAPTTTFRDTVQRFDSLWNRSEAQLGKLPTKLPNELFELISLQHRMQNLSLEVHLATAVADSLGQTLRRLQQAGGN